MSTEPVNIPAITLTPNEQLSAFTKSAILQQRANSGTTPGGKDVTMQISDKEINAMLQQLSGWNESPLKIGVTITGGIVDTKGYFHFRDKYINVMMDMTVTGSDGIILGNIISLQIGDRFIGTGLNIDGKNVFSKLYEDPETIQLLQRIKHVMVSGNTLNLTLQ